LLSAPVLATSLSTLVIAISLSAPIISTLLSAPVLGGGRSSLHSPPQLHAVSCDGGSEQGGSVDHRRNTGSHQGTSSDRPPIPSILLLMPAISIQLPAPAPATRRRRIRRPEPRYSSD
jgi:hypothetical protein